MKVGHRKRKKVLQLTSLSKSLVVPPAGWKKNVFLICHVIATLWGTYVQAAEEDDENDNGLPFDLWNKLAPVAFGAEFLVCPENGELKIEVAVQWACYYRCVPDL